MKINAIKISGKLFKAVKLKKKVEYEELITNHLLKLMMEDERDNIRREGIANVDLNAKTIPFIITRCLDKSSKVRVEVYKALKQSTAVGFLDLESEDRL